MRVKLIVLTAVVLVLMAGLAAQTTTLSVDTQIAAANVTQGTIKHSIFHFHLRHTGDGTVNLSGITFTTAGTYTATDVTKFQLWTYTSDTFSSATQLGSDITTGLGTGAHPLTFTNQTIPNNTTYYYWITTDVAIDATTSRTLNVSAWDTNNFTVNGTKAGSASAGGTQTITAFASLSTDYFRSNGTGNWGTAGTWQSSHNNSNWATATSTPTNAANTITIRNGHTVTVAASVSTDQTTIDSGGQVNVSSGQTLTIAAGAEATDLTVNGTLRNNAGTITTTGTLAFGSGGLYQHNYTTAAGTIPTATWDTNSTCEVVGYTSNTATPSGLGQSFGNFTWNCTNQTGAISADETLVTVNGNLSIVSTGTGSFILGNGTNTTTVGGSLLISGGTFNMNNKAVGGAQDLTINLAGNFTMSGGTLTKTATDARGYGVIVFNGSSTQTLSKTSGTISNAINFTINSGAILAFDTATTVLDGSSGTFTASSGSTLIIKHAAGIAASGATGCVQTTGTRTFNTGANYTYTGSTAQVTGTGLTGANNLTFSNTAGTTLSAAVNTIAGTCTIDSGATLATNNFNMAFQGNFVNSGTFTAGSSNITIGAGTATQSIAGFTTTGTVSMTKTGGTATFAGNVNGGALTINGLNGTLNLGTGLTHTFTGTWTRTNGTLNGGTSTLRLGAGSSGTGGTFTANTGTVEYYASGTQTIAAVTYNNLTLSGTSAKTITGATVNGVFSIEGTATTTGTVLTYGAASSLRYNGSGIQTVGIEWPSTFARPITISNTNGVTLNASKAAYSGTLTNNGKLNCLSYQLTGTVNNNGTITAARTDIMSSGTLTNNTGSTIEYTTPLTIPASTGYYNLKLSASGTYFLGGNVTGINVLTLTNADTYLHPAGYTLGYTTLAGSGSIINTPLTTLASTSPAVAAANISQAALKNPVYRFTLTRDGTAGTVNLTGLSFTTAGSATSSDITNFQLWTSSSDALSGATKIGTDVTSGQGAGSHNFGTFSQALTVSTTRYFWITADIASGATTTRTITVSALTTSDLSLSDGSKTGTASAGGQQTISTLTVTLASTNPAVAAAYVAPSSVLNPIYRFTLTSTGENTLTAFAFRTEASSTFVTADLTRFQLWSSTTDLLSGATQVGNDLTTMAADGLNNTFTSVSQALATGVTRYFWITVDVNPSATNSRVLTVTALTTARFTVTGTKAGTASIGGTQTVNTMTTLASANPAVAAASIGRGTLKNPIYRFTLITNSDLTLSGLTFTCTGTYLAADIDNFRLWSSTTDDLSTASQVGSTLTSIAASGSTQTFASVSQALSAYIMRYFWITTDLDEAATATRYIIPSALTTSNITVSTGSKTGTAYASGTQTIANPTTTLSSTNPAVPAGIVAISSSKNPIYRFVLTRDAATGTVNFTNLSFTTSGTYVAADLTKFQLWGSSSDDLAGADPVGVDLTTGLGTGSHSFAAFTQPLSVSSAMYFWITADVSSGATSSNTLTVTALTTTEYTVSLGNKAGTAAAGGTQTIGSLSTTLASNSPAVVASDLAQSQTKRALHRFTLSSNGNITVSAISFTSGGDYAAADIAKFQLWTGILDDLNAACQVGSDISSSLGTGSHAFSSLALPLSASVTQYFWITTDAAAAATSGKYINVSALSTSDITVSSGSKSGSTSAGGNQTFCEAREWLYAKGQTIGQLADAGTNYQVRVKVFRSTGTDSGESVYVGTNCREDFGDIRFFEDYTPLDYWMETATYGTSAVFWVEMNGNLSSSDLFLVMRYGNTSVTTTSNGTNTFLFFDDFNRSDDTFAKWTKHKTLNGSTISIPKGNNFSRNGGGIIDGTYGHTVLGSSATYSSFSNGIVEFRYRVATDAICEVGIRGTFANPGTGYKGRSDARTGTQGGQSFLAPPYYTWSFLADAGEDLDSPTPNTWYRGTISAYGTTMKLYRDDTLKRTSNSGTTSGPGEVSLQNHYGSYTDYDWAIVRKFANADPTRGTWLAAPVAVAATAVCHNGFTSRWNTASGATGYKLDVLESDGTTYVTGWQDISVSLNVKRVEIIDIDTSYKYRIRAVYAAGTSPSSNVIDVSTTAIVDGISATTSIEGASILTYVPPVTGGPSITDNDVTIDPTGTSTDDFSIEISYHPTGFDIWPNARLLATISCTNNSALNGTYTLNHVGLGFTPAAAAYRWVGSWSSISPTFSANNTVVTISGLSKGAKGTLEIVLDDGSGTLPVELSSFLVQFSANNQVVVQWVTQSETNVSGFTLYRGTENDVELAEHLQVFIPATNTSQMQIYQYTDTDPLNVGVYYYWLENMDLDGATTLYGPVSITITDGQTDTPPIPVVAGINSIYPNPFNPNTRIVFGITKKGFAELEIYNLKGQLVKRLISEPKDKGTYQISWDGTNQSGQKVGSGVYVARMKSVDGTWVKRMVLNK